MPQPADLLELGFLSECEQELIMGVLRRDEELRRIEEKRVRSGESAVTLMIKECLQPCTSVRGGGWGSKGFRSCTRDDCLAFIQFCSDRSCEEAGVEIWYL